MKEGKWGGWVGGLAMLVAALVPNDSHAIAAWARRYGANCNMCHQAGYKLNLAGQDFLRAGHQLLGNKGEEGLSNHASLTAKIRAYYNRTDSAGSITDISQFEHHAFSFYGGGPLDAGFTYFAEMYFAENTGKTSSGDFTDDYQRSKLAEAYLQYVTGEEDQYWSFRAGQVAPSLLHLHGVGARLTQDRPLYFGKTVIDNPYRVFTRQYGVTAAKKLKDLFIEVGLVNGTGAKTTNRIDNNSAKDVWATMDYRFDANGSMLGVFGYKGLYPVQTDKAATYGSDDSFYQVGFAGNLTSDRFGILGAFFLQNDAYKTFAGVDTSLNSMGGYGEFQYYLDGTWQPFFRFDYFDKDSSVSNNEELGGTLGVNWKVLEHGRFVFHVNHMMTNPGGASPKTTNQVMLEMQWMY